MLRLRPLCQRPKRMDVQKATAFWRGSRGQSPLAGPGRSPGLPAVNPAWVVRTARLVLTPVCWSDLADLAAIKADPLVFALMLGGVRTRARAVEELALDQQFWAARGVGIWTVREAGTFLGLAGLHLRPDGRGMALRFGLWPDARGRGLAREAGRAALGFAHDRAGIARVIAVAREDNFASRTVLGGIGMAECEGFRQRGHWMVLYESVRRRPVMRGQLPEPDQGGPAGRLSQAISPEAGASSHRSVPAR